MAIDLQSLGKPESTRRRVYEAQVDALLRGEPHTLRGIAEKVGLSQPGNVKHHIARLVDGGALRYHDGRVALPDGAVQDVVLDEDTGEFVVAGKLFVD